ncbi:MAG: hypothetical protein KAV87_35880 [Desulfobacteraceae bacterium]|nr:hypothetical protein [Desulfobacteraceae bacterium]
MTINMSELVRGGTICLSQSAVAMDTDENDILMAAPNGAGTDFAINGILYHKADGTGIEVSAAIQAALTSCLYLFCLSTAGAVTVVKGTEVTTADITSGKSVLTWPVPTADTCCFGAVRIDTAAAVTFTMGTDDFSKASVTDTFYSLMAVPDTPLTS